MSKKFIIITLILFAGIFCGCNGDSESIWTESSSFIETTSIVDSTKESEESVFQKEEKISDEKQDTRGEETALDVLYVHIVGAVDRPGIYILPVGSRVYEGIEMAGGFLDGAAVEYINQADYLKDTQQIIVPTVEEVEQGMATPNLKETQQIGTAPPSLSGKVNLNSATQEELMTLSGIGLAKAQAILTYRGEIGKFEKIEDIMNIEGIKEGVFNKIKDKITVRQGE